MLLGKHNSLFILYIIVKFSSKAIHKVDIPAHDWPIANFPRYKYPLEKHEEHNRSEDEKCLKQVKELIASRKKDKRDVAAVIVEPIQSEGGDHHASAEFFHGLQKIEKSNDFGRAQVGNIQRYLIVEQW